MPVPPTASDDTFVQSTSGPTTIPKSTILSNDVVPCGTQATITPVTDPLYGTVTQKSDGSFVYTPTGVRKTDNFDYEVTCNGLTSRATITLPAPPVAVNDVYMLGFSTSTSISGPGVLTNDQVG